MLKSLSITALFVSANLFANVFDYDHCSSILREGTRDSLASSSSKKHALVKHNQFCSIAKKYNLNSENFLDFAEHYSQHVKARGGGAGGDGGVGFGPFSFEASYSQEDQSSDISEEDRKTLLLNNKVTILDYFASHCGDSTYQEYLESEAQSISKIANTHVVQAWKECMLKKHGVFAFIEGDKSDDMERRDFGVRVEWYNSGNNYIKELYLIWHGDNIESSLPLMERVNAFQQTQNICKDRHLYSGANVIIPIHRKSVSQRDLIYLTAVTDNAFMQAFAIFVAKKQIVHLENNAKSRKPKECERLRKHALESRMISHGDMKDLIEDNEAPVLVGQGHKKEILGWVDCSLFEDKN